MFCRLFLLVLSVAQKDIERAEEKEKKRRREEDFDLSLSFSFLFFSTKKKQINRFILQIPSSFFFFFFSLAREIS
jgi:hypothetical protein